MVDGFLRKLKDAIVGPDGEQVGDGGESGQVRLGFRPAGQDSVVVQACSERRPTADDRGVVEHLRVLRHQCDAVDAPERRSTNGHPAQG